MEKIENQIRDDERAFYNSIDTEFENIKIDGPADGESAFKECSNIFIDKSFFNLRYPFWHNNTLWVKNSELTDLCRAAFWYDKKVICENVKSKGIKAFRECEDVCLNNCDFYSEEIFWNVKQTVIHNSKIEGVYAFFQCKYVEIDNLEFKGKYSFQYTKNVVIRNSNLDTKDAFWHSKNVLVENCIVKGEYLGWYSDGLTLKNCKIIGTQPLCYASRLKIIDCTFENCDLSFEYSDVKGNIVGDIDSIKNPLKGKLIISGKTTFIQDENDRSKGRFIIIK